MMIDKISSRNTIVISDLPPKIRAKKKIQRLKSSRKSKTLTLRSARARILPTTYRTWSTI